MVILSYVHTIGESGDKTLKQMVGSQVRGQGGGRCGGEEKGVAHPGQEDIFMIFALENDKGGQKMQKYSGKGAKKRKIFHH